MYENNKKIGFAFIAVMSFGSVVSARAEDTIEEAWNAHFQTTYVWQKKPSFSAPYTGVNSFTSFPEKSYSFSSTAALGWRPWTGHELGASWRANRRLYPVARAILTGST